MSEKFRNKYRVQSTRLRNWDYGSRATYFITICTQNRERYFGEVQNCEMMLSEIGKIVEHEWLKTPGMRSDMNLHLGEFVIMPDHFHAIIGIGKNKYNTGIDRENKDDNSHETDLMVHTKKTNITRNKFGSQSKNLASIMRGFKSSVTISARKIHTEFKWQSGFHDHIIRNHKSLHRISDYIITNPEKENGNQNFRIT